MPCVRLEIRLCCGLDYSHFHVFIHRFLERINLKRKSGPSAYTEGEWHSCEALGKRKKKKKKRLKWAEAWAVLQVFISLIGWSTMEKSLRIPTHPSRLMPLSIKEILPLDYPWNPPAVRWGNFILFHSVSESVHSEFSLSPIFRQKYVTCWQWVWKYSKVCLRYHKTQLLILTTICMTKTLNVTILVELLKPT